MCQCAKVSMCQCAMAHLCLFANLLLASFSAAGHNCPGTNSWCYLPFEDSVLVLFLPFWAPYFIRQKKVFFFFKKGHSPQQIWLKICVWNPEYLLDLNPRAGQWEIFGPKIWLRVRM